MDELANDESLIQSQLSSDRSKKLAIHYSSVRAEFITGMPAFAIASFFPQALEMLYEDNSITITQKNTFKELARKDLLEAHVRSYVRLLNGEYL